MTGELITVAVPKGRLLEEASLLFERAVGVSPKALLTNTRKLRADAPEAGKGRRHRSNTGNIHRQGFVH